MIRGYPSVYQIGHRAIEGIFNGPVSVEEKVDGSQFSMGVFGGELECRSKNQQIILNVPDSLFTQAVAAARQLKPLMREGVTYRCEYLQRPHHNALAYARIPTHHLIVYDVDVGIESYCSVALKTEWAAELGLECVPCFFEGMVSSLEMFKELLERESCLGGCKVEGIVIKNYSLFTGEKKVAMGKYVSEAFKETHAKEWGKANPSGQDISQRIIESLRTDARWQKALQHLRENGQLEGSPKDIALLIREVPNDILKEEESNIRDILFKHFWKQISRGVVAGLPTWYKEQLVASALAKDTSV